jgi:hypothetical protein
MDIIARIKHKLAYLQEHDDGDMLDADFKRQQLLKMQDPYNVHTPHTEDEIAAFEVQHGIRLPADYRRFIMEIGSEGYNPGYNMYSPLKDEEERLTWVDLGKPFPFRNTMTYEDIIEFGKARGVYSPDDEEIDIDLDKIFVEYIDSGCLYFIYAGCQCWYILIITGEARGQIWSADLPMLFTPVMLLDGELFEADIDPSMAANAQRVTFTEWYEAWLNKQISIAQEHWRKRGRSVPSFILNDN